MSTGSSKFKKREGFRRLRLKNIHSKPGEDGLYDIYI